MSIECGARAGMIAPDDTTFRYLEGRPYVPQRAAWEEAVGKWRQLVTDEGATFDSEIALDGSETRAHRHLGHESRDVSAGHRARFRIQKMHATPPSVPPCSRRSNTWGWKPAPASKTSRLTASLSARAPTDASKTFAPPPVCCAATKFIRAWMCWLCPVRKQ